MSYIIHFLPAGYFHTKNEMIAVNIVEVIEQKLIHLQTDRQGETKIIPPHPLLPQQLFFFKFSKWKATL